MAIVRTVSEVTVTLIEDYELEIDQSVDTAHHLHLFDYATTNGRRIAVDLHDEDTGAIEDAYIVNDPQSLPYVRRQS